MQYKFNKGVKLNPMQILSLGFLLIILIGGILLSLPISSSTGEYTSFIDAVFTSTSAVCVTGLSNCRYRNSLELIWPNCNYAID